MSKGEWKAQVEWGSPIPRPRWNNTRCRKSLPCSCNYGVLIKFQRLIPHGIFKHNVHCQCKLSCSFSWGTQTSLDDLVDTKSWSRLIPIHFTYWLIPIHFTFIWPYWLFNVVCILTGWCPHWLPTAPALRVNKFFEYTLAHG